RGANSQTLGHALPRISVTFEITGKKSGRTMNLPFIFLPDLTDEDVNGATAALVANVTTLIQQQSNAIDGAHMEPLPLAYVFKTNRGWVTDWQLVQEMVQRQAKTKQQGQSKRRRSKRG